jgi:hypothetical protein
MKTLYIVVCVTCLLSIFGCGNSGESDLTETDKKKMDTLFREGIKPGKMESKPPTKEGATGPGASEPALNQPTD